MASSFEHTSSLTEPNKEVLSDSDSWGSDFDDENSEHYQEIQDNKINETLEAQLFKDSSENIVSQTSAASGLDESSRFTKTAYNNVIPSNSVTTLVKPFSYITNNTAVRVLKDVLNQNSEEGTGAIPKSSVLHLKRNSKKEFEGNNTSKAANESQLNQRNAPVSSEEISIRGASRKAGTNASQQETNFSASQNMNAEFLTDNCTDSSPRDFRTKQNISQNKTPGRLRPEAFSFLETTNESADETANKNEDFVKRIKKIVTPTVFVHAAKFGNQNTLENKPDSISKETYEWSLPSVTKLNVRDNKGHENNRVTADGNSNDKQFENTLTKPEIKPVKPPLPSRPPPVFMYPAKTFPSNNEISLKESKSERNVRTSKPGHFAISSASVTSQHNFIDSVVKMPSTLENNKNDNEDKRTRRVATNVSKLLPPKPIPASSNCATSESLFEKKENTDNSSVGKSLSGSQIFEETQLPITTSRQTSEHQPDAEDFNQYEINNAEILSQKLPVAPKENIGKPQFSSRNSFDSSTRKDCELETEFSLPKVARVLSVPQQNITERKMAILKEKCCNQVPGTLDSISFLDEIRLNAIQRPSLPEKLQPSQKSLSYNSLVQSIKDIGFAKKHQNDKNKRSSSDAAATVKPSKDIATKKDDSKLSIDSKKMSSIILNVQEAHSKVSQPQLWKNSVENYSLEDNIARHAWFHNVDSKRASHRLSNMKQDGAFLIRPSSYPTQEQPYTACVSFAGRVLNLHIRHLANGYALGKQKEGEKIFPSLSNMIKYHQDVPVEIRTGSTGSTGCPFYVRFLVTPPK